MFVPKQCKFYNRGTCRYGTQCQYLHRDLRSDISSEEIKRLKCMDKEREERKKRDYEESRRFYKTGEWVMTVKHTCIQNAQEPEEKEESIKTIYEIPSFIRPEDVKDSVVVSNSVIDCYKNDHGFGYCKYDLLFVHIEIHSIKTFDIDV